MGNPGYAGPIVTSALLDGGSGWAPDDAFTLDTGFGDDPTGHVVTVAGDAIATYAIDTPGLATVDSYAVVGAGTAQIDVTEIDPQTDTTGRLTVWYRIVDLAPYGA